MEAFWTYLRRDREIPANQAMDLYFEPSQVGGFKGQRRITLPVRLDNDLEVLNKYQNNHLSDHNYSKRLRLNDKIDLDQIRDMAQDRRKWRELVHQMTIVRTGDAEGSVEPTATSH